MRYGNAASVEALNPSALTIAQKARPLKQTMRLRGGGAMAPVIVSATAAIGGATGVSMYLGTEKFTKILWLGASVFSRWRVMFSRIKFPILLMPHYRYALPQV